MSVWCDDCVNNALNRAVDGVNKSLKCSQCVTSNDPLTVPSNYVHKEATTPKILDSGGRTEYSTGAVRDLKEKKGRCDLMPLSVLSHVLGNDRVLLFIDSYIYDGATDYLYGAISEFFTRQTEFNDIYSMIIDLSHHYEDGLEKYPERNWELGIPLNSYIDSAIRHYLKWLRGDKDEPHARAFVWNILNCICTHNKFKDDLTIMNLPFNKQATIKTTSE